jgi:peptide/nickel transport system substrate-binding protein
MAMTTLNRRQFIGSTAAAIAAVGLSPRPVFSKEGNVERVTHAISAGDIGSLDPTLNWTSAEVAVVTVVMEGLVSYPPGIINTDFQPALAESWDVSEDGKAYTFKLRKGVKWHGDFGEFTSADVKFTLDRCMDPKVSPWAPNFRNVESVEAVDDYTVRIRLKTADPFFLSLLATDTESVGLMVSKKAFETRGADAMRQNPIGTGPFAFHEYAPKDKIVMVRHDAYWAGKPKLGEVVIRFMPSSAARELALGTGEIDSMRAALDGQVVKRLAAQGYAIDIKGPEINWWLHINTRIKPLDDIRVRQAISHAVNSADVQLLLGDVATVPEQMVGPAYFGAASPGDFTPEEKWGHDPDKAKALLKQAGFPNGFPLKMIISERDDYRQMMTLMQEQLKEVGINLELEKVDHAYYHGQNVKHVNPLVLFGDITYPNTEILLTRAFRTGAMRNFSGWNSPEFDALLDKITATPTLEPRVPLLVEAQKRVADQFVLRPVVFTRQPLVRNKRVDLGYKLISSLALEYRYGYLAQVKA